MVHEEANTFFEFNNESPFVNLIGVFWNGCAPCVCYKSPSTKFSKIIGEFELMLEKAIDVSSKVIVIGDLNVDLASKHNHNLFRILKENDLSYRLPIGEYSTNDNTQIDIVFSNSEVPQFCFYESYFS